MKSALRGLLAAAVVAGGLAAAPIAASADDGGGGGATPATPAPTIGYDAIGTNDAGNYPSQAFQAQQVTEFGDGVKLQPGTPRKLQSVTVMLSVWACQSKTDESPCVTTPGATFTHPMVLSIYQRGADGNPGALVAQVSETKTIPYRPSGDPSCGDGFPWKDTAGTCWNGYATPITFEFPTLPTVPDELVWSLAFNTSTYGSPPMGTQACSSEPQGCPYDSLNVALASDSSAFVGTDLDPDGVVIKSTWTGAYCTGNQSPLGVFRVDSGCWAPYRPMATITMTPQCTTDCYVAITGDDALNGGTSPSDAKRTIQAGVDAVQPGGTVHVGAGDYVLSSPVQINKSVALLGPNAGVSPNASNPVQPNGARVAEATLSPAGANRAIQVGGQDVTIDGFRFTDPHTAGASNETLIGAGGNFGGDASGLAVRNNLFAGISRIAVYTNGPTRIADVTVENNRVYQPTRADGCGTGALANSNCGRQLFNLWKVDGVSFSGNAALSTAGNGDRTRVLNVNEASDVLIADNVVRNACVYTCITLAAGVDDVTITGNDVDIDVGNAVQLHPDFTAGKVVIDHNTFRAPGGSSVIVDAPRTSPIDLSQVTIARNAILAGPVASLVGQRATASCNWWGQSSGPLATQTVGPVTVADWLTSADLDGDCEQGIVTDQTVVVSQTNPAWRFIQENAPGTGQSGAFVTGPAGQPLGAGSVQLDLTTSAQSQTLITSALGGTRLADISELSYSTYQDAAGPSSVSLQFSIQYTAGATGWQGRLVYEPYMTTGTVAAGWSNWNTLQGKWWASGAPGNGSCGQSTPCTWDQILALFPDARVNASDPQLLLRAGSGGAAPFTGNADDLVVGVRDSHGDIARTTYDFEPLGAVTDTTEVVDETSTDWAFYQEHAPGSGQTGTFVDGPTGSLGDGSAEFVLDSAGQSQTLGTPRFGGTRLADITDLRYSSFQDAGTAAVALQLNVNYTAAATGWQGRLVYEPYQTYGTVPGGWQQWDTLQGKWWASGAPGNTVCPQASPCTWDQIVGLFPDAHINTGDPQVLFRAGSGWNGFSGNVDQLIIGIADADLEVARTTFDFEHTPLGPTTETTVVVDAGNADWAFEQPEAPGTGQSGGFVKGPAGQPTGIGSAQLGVTTSAQSQELITRALGGTRLVDITDLSYWSYQDEGTAAVSLQMSVHFSAGASGWQGRLVYEPVYTVGTVPQGWHEWDALQGNWWTSNAVGSPCDINNGGHPCSWAEILGLFPNAHVNDTDPQVLFRAGRGGTVPFTGNVDDLTVGVASGADRAVALTHYDFEPHDATCVATGSTLITDVSDFDQAVIRSSGHFEVIDGAAHLWTDDDSSNAKVAGFIDAPGTRLGSTFDIDWDGTSPGPGAWIVLSDGSVLIGETVYGNTFWTDPSDPAAGYAPQTGGGNGSPYFGTPDQWQAEIDARGITVERIGFSLGSGVKGDGILTSVTVGCHTITFDLPEVVEPPVDPEEPEPPIVLPPVAPNPDFNPVSPVRLVDTRVGAPQGLVSVPRVKLSATPLAIKVTDLTGLVPEASVVGAVSLNVTAAGSAAGGYISVQPCGASNEVSSVNFQAAKDRANAVIVPVSAQGEICVTANVPVDVIIDLNGWFRAAQGYVPVTPVRVFDTRAGAPSALRPVAKQQVAPGAPLQVQLTDLPGGVVPATGVASVSLNVTAAGPAADGYVSVQPCGVSNEVSSVNFRAGADTANAVIVPVAANGTVCFSSSVATDLVVDVNSWFRAGSDLQPVTPVRVFDTRAGAPSGLRVVAKQQVAPGAPLEVQFTDLPGGVVPADGVYTVSLNVTTAGAKEAGYVTVTPCGPLGEVSSVNFQAGADTANAVLTGVSSTGKVCFSASTPVDVLVDINGWFKQPIVAG